MADSIRKHMPQLWRIAKLLYGEPSTLFVNCDGETHTVPSRTGIRQGDVFGPLFFSLAIRPMLEKIQEHHTLRAYADDVQVHVNDEQEKDKLIAMLEELPPEIKAGLQVNKSTQARPGSPLLWTFAGKGEKSWGHLLVEKMQVVHKS